MTLRPLALLLSAALSAALCGCAALPDAQTKLVGSRAIEFAARSRTAPVVVFESGLGGRMEWWGKVLSGLANDTSYFVYNRPGYGNSAPADTPRDGNHVVEELRAVLSGQGMKPPYVLVGHSLGGLYMQLFARKHPQEVAALILVDSTHPKQFEGAGALENQSIWVRVALKILVTGSAKEELDLLEKTGEQVLELPTLSGVPILVLSASYNLKETSDIARFTNEKRADIANMYPGSKQIWIDSGHAIPLEKPEAVIDAIRSALIEAQRAQQ